MPQRSLSSRGFADLLSQLQQQGYALIGPTVRDGAIAFEQLSSAADLPRGIGEEQAAGRYRLVERDDERLFGFASTSRSFKHVFHPPRQQLFALRRSKDGSQLVAPSHHRAPVALIGARGCDIAGLSTLDGVLAGEPPVDAGYAERRRDVFIVAVHCSVAGGTCFCTSMGTGPRAAGPFDLALTEIDGGSGVEYLVEAGSERGQTVLDTVESKSADQEQVELAAETERQVREAITRRVDAHAARSALRDNPEHPRWNEVAERCLACGNCTMVCPTCFCSTVEERNQFQGEEGDETMSRDRVWDSCFTSDFTHLHGGSVRASTMSRYRQWLTHKFSSWFDQFAQSGCVGCGRCITWCPVAIDVTEEIAAIAKQPEHGSEVGHD